MNIDSYIASDTCELMLTHQVFWMKNIWFWIPDSKNVFKKSE